MKPSATSLIFARLCVEQGLPEPTPEFKFCETRRWRFDYAWVEQKVALEQDGGLFVNGYHARGGGIEKEHEKFNEAACLGWRILRVQPRGLLKLATISLLRRAIYYEN